MTLPRAAWLLNRSTPSHLPSVNYEPSPRKRLLHVADTPKLGGPLEQFNDKAEYRMLHATKGWRTLNVERSRAAIIVAGVMRGEHWPMNIAARFLTQGL